MFNLFKVTTFLNNVPTFTTDHRVRIAPQDANPLFLSPNKNRKPSPYKPEEKESKQTKGKGNKKDNDDNDNNNGGFLEPIIEDLQGFLKGRRSPVMNVWTKWLLKSTY